MTLSEQEIYEEARTRVKQKRGFLGHLMSYLSINAVLVIIWALSGRGYMWFLWPMGVWGAFVVLNFLDVFLVRGSMSEAAAIRREVERIKKGV